MYREMGGWIVCLEPHGKVRARDINLGMSLSMTS